MCMIESADGYAQCSSTRTVKASRKDHRCGECYRVITKGESYRYDAGVWDGYFYSNKTCTHCQIAQAWLSGQCGGWVGGGVLEDIQEHGPVYRIPDLYRLEIGMKRKWKRFDGAGLMAIPRMPRIVKKEPEHKPAGEYPFLALEH